MANDMVELERKMLHEVRSRTRTSTWRVSMHAKLDGTEKQLKKREARV